MFSQSLLFALWRETAAPPDSSASSQADTTPGSSPVSAARREANCCWADVSIVPALAGRTAAPPGPGGEPAMALDSADEKVDAPAGVGSAGLTEAADVAEGGRKAVCRPEISV